MVTDLSTGKHRLIDPNGTMYQCDASGFKKINFLPKITGFQNYKHRIKESLANKVSLNIFKIIFYYFIKFIYKSFFI